MLLEFWRLPILDTAKNMSISSTQSGVRRVVLRNSARSGIHFFLLFFIPLGHSLAQDVASRSFALSPTLTQAALSPAGTYVAGRAFVNGKAGLMVYNLDKLRTVVSAEFTDATIDSLRWADEKTLLHMPIRL